MPTPTSVTELCHLLTTRLVAYIAGVDETRPVNEWAVGTRTLDVATGARLRIAARAVDLLPDQDPQMIQAWFTGLNPVLEDRSPANLIREGEPTDVEPLILAAASAWD